MSQQQYFASNEKDEVELNRLRLVERFSDPATIRRLEMIRVTEGWHCLEVGAGAGSVAQWLSSRVGRTGKVVATDIDTRFLRQLSIPNLEIRQHDIVKDDLETDLYDLVHCRTVLMHLPDPEKGLKRMASAVRPGGWLLIEEADYGSSLSIDVTNPSAVILTSTCRALWDFLRKKGIVDPYFGRRVRGLMEQLEFNDVDQEGLTRINRGGEPYARFTAMTLQAAAKPMIAGGLLTQEQHDSVQRLLMDPAFTYLGLTLFAAWGRRPANQV
jgi:ubiquinone/menaquinone biosynthesis C-methylase UbiE